MTQDLLATASGIEQSNVSAIENGRRRPSVETLHRLVHACGYGLALVAGTTELVLPPPDDGLEDPTDTMDVAPPLPRDLPMEVRVRMLTGALEAAEAIVRAR